MRFLRARLGGQALAVLAVCGVCVATTATPGEAAAPLPVKMVNGVPNPNTPDPGVILENNTFYALSTGGPGALMESTSSTAGGPWTTPVSVLSGSLPSWVDSTSGIWAPDMIKTTSGKYVIYFAAALSSSAIKASGTATAVGARCIGTAESSMPDSGFVAAPEPLVCLPGYGAADDMPSNPSDTRVSDQGVIDASPRFVTIDGNQELFLVYKTQGLPATIRMVRLADDDGVSVVGTSHQLVDSASETIEAPSLVQNGSYFILFVAHGSYLDCTYSTQWYKSQNIWSWTDTGATTVLDTSSSGGLCGPGSADVTSSEVSGQDRIFFHGWVGNGTTNVPGNAAGAIRVMYAAVLTFASDGFTPVIGAYQGQS